MPKTTYYRIFTTNHAGRPDRLECVLPAPSASDACAQWLETLAGTHSREEWRWLAGRVTAVEVP